jgi:anthranilate synthase/aminodeoxychorismate synthase-like glutamine amidotransferase
VTVLLLDNYDSFTWNLAQYLRELGAEVEVNRNDRIASADDVSSAFEAVVISPGPGRPENAGVSVELIRDLAGRLPILGVCLGHQALALAFGGAITPAPTLMHGKTSPVFHDGRTIFSGLPNPFEATRYHSLVVDPSSVPDVFEISARTVDGVVMGLRHRELPLEGVQFHPESIMTVGGLRLLSSFLERVGSRRVREVRDRVAASGSGSVGHVAMQPGGP